MALVSVEKLAQALNLTPRRVQQLVREGLPRAEKGRYDLGKCMAWYIRYLQAALERRQDSTYNDPLTQDRHRLIKAQADREEHELARARADVIPVQVYEEHVAARVMAARQQLLNLPQRVAPQLEGENRTVIKAKLDAAIRGALTALATVKDNAPSSGSDSKPSAG